jgi:hypothetical protein
MRNFLKQFILEDMNFDFLPIDLHYCLSENEEILEAIKTHLVMNLFIFT